LRIFYPFFHEKKLLRFPSLGFCGSSGKRGNALAALGLKSFKVACFGGVALI